MLQIVDTGLGSLDSNAATVFSQLQNATNKVGIINTFPNINTSVQVLFKLSQKQSLTINDELAVDVSITES